MNPALFIEELYKRVEQSRQSGSEEDLDDTLDFIFDSIDDALLAGEFGAVDESLRLIDTDRIGTQFQTSVLTISAGARHLLPQYQDFFKRSYESTLKSEGPERLPHIFCGLDPKGL